MQIKEGDFIYYNGTRKKVFGIHTNNNIILKMKGTLVQVYKEEIKLIK